MTKEKIGINDHFLALGGDSLQAAQIVNKINKDFSSSVISLQQFIEKPTAKELSLEIQKNITTEVAIPVYQINASTEDSNINSVRHNKWSPLSYGQIFYYFGRHSNVFRNIGFKLYMQGSLDCALLEQCINILLERHPALRLQISVFSPKQRETNYKPFKLEPIDISHLKVKEVTTIWQSAIDSPIQLATPIKLSIRLFMLSKTDFVLLVNLPHIVCDGIGLQVLRDELMHLYRSLSEGKTPKLETSAAHYFDFIREEISELKDLFPESVNFWDNLLKPDYFLIADTDDINSPPKIKNNLLSFEFKGALLIDFLEFCRKNYYTHAIALNAIFALTIAKQFRKKSIVFIDYEVNRGDRKYANTIGEFESQNMHQFNIDEKL